MIQKEHHLNYARQILHHDQRRIFIGKAQWIGLLAIVQ
jgi:hypothetical protein